MRLSRIGALASFGLTLQFAATLAWIVAALPRTGIAGLGDLTEAMAAYFVDFADAPVSFTFLNLYNASFGITAIVLVVVMRERMRDAPLRMQLAVIAITIAATLFLASGIIPNVVDVSQFALNDPSALRATVGIVTGLVLAATTAAGFGVSLSGWAALDTGHLPKPLCWLLIADGLMQIAEFATPLFLILDPLAGTIWSISLGLLLWRSKE